MKRFVVCLLVAITVFECCVFVLTSNITRKILEKNVNGVLAAFGDFNADKLTDVFFITKEGTTVDVYLAHEKEPILRKGVNCTFAHHHVSSIVPGDYDGDSQMDLLVTLQRAKREVEDRTVIFKILWGKSLENCTVTEDEEQNQRLKDQPLVLDYNGDKIPDIYGEAWNGSRQIWLMSSDRTFRVEKIDVENEMRRPHSNAFVDLDGDLAADIFVTTKDQQFEMWHNKHGYWKKYSGSHQFPNVKIIGQSTFADFNLDGKLDHIVPVCFDEKCTNCSIHVYTNKTWEPIANSLKDGNDNVWGFVNNFNQPITLRVGDYDLDGFPDVVAVMFTTETRFMQKAILFHNQPCSDDQLIFKRCFAPKWNFPALSAILNVTHVAFFDIYQNGNLDLFVVSNDDLDKNGVNRITAIQNTDTNDACFIKVLVLSGLCYNDCQNDKQQPFGVNQPGPFILYSTTMSNGSHLAACAAQLSQSAYFPLQLPYTVFGLGQTPNFVDSLTIGIPPSNESKKHTHSWPSIIPNSQMVVIPLRNKGDTEDYQWMNKLFVTPSHQVLLTFFALLGTCFLIIIVIGGLYWKEKVADRKEKQQEAHRFHFDAM